MADKIGQRQHLLPTVPVGDGEQNGRKAQQQGVKQRPLADKGAATALIRPLVVKQLDLAPGLRSDMVNAPGAVTVRTAQGVQPAVPVDIKRVEVDLIFDQATKTIKAHARVTFEQLEAGCPIVDLAVDPEAVHVDGGDLLARDYRRHFFRSRPRDEVRIKGSTGNATTHTADSWLEAYRAHTGKGEPELTAHRIISKPLEAGEHTLEVSYALNRGSLSQVEANRSIATTGGGFKFFTRMEDSDTAIGSAYNFLETYVPANMEYDHFPVSMQLRFEGAARKHAIFSNGAVERLPGDSEAYRVEFPAYFNASAPYLHVTDPEHVRRQDATFQSGDGRRIPVTIYADVTNYKERAKCEKDLADARRIALETLAEMEDLAGPYMHDSLTIRLRPRHDPSESRGMEYAGATDTAIVALRHELIHSWFGRGVMPASGDAGWLDEGLTYWIGHGMAPMDPRELNEQMTRGEVRDIATNSPYIRQTVPAAWPPIGGAEDFMAMADAIIREHGQQGGLGGLLPTLMQQYRGRSLSVEGFKDFLVNNSPLAAKPPLTLLFARYGYNFD